MGRALALALGLGLACGAGACMPPSWGAGAMLHPQKRSPKQRPDQRFEELRLAGDGVRLAAWAFPTSRPRRGTIIWLHGVGDSRGSSLWPAQHLTGRGFDVLAYDSRAHGDSEGEACTYGYFEKRDLRRVLDTVTAPPIVLLGHSMGAAVALQAAADEPRVAPVVAVATFSDLRTVATERAPFVASKGNIEEALRIAEQQGKFVVAEVSPVAAARQIRAPTLIIHGEHDDETPADHSRRVYQALPGPNKRLLIAPGRGHGDALNADTWREVDRWMDSLFPVGPA
jgi:alpha-beta hydrolase superfamily lysophospholipase